MKSLSDYTQILRSTATNLNLHGESVEMVVQMLANALYISEVEHVAYSQEASLERATQDNSKIQHCVNQMYSVFRGANPRVIINFKASKLFTFKPHQEIIKSNNYTVYYLGYFNEDTGTIQYSDFTIYPDTTVTIVGLLSKEVITRSWTVGVENPYYYTLPVSNLSGDLYLDINNTRTDVTRIFSDHLRLDLPFDLTLPGYGLRLYYPESLQGESGCNVSYSLSVYEYMSLSEIQESEKKVLKMNGSRIISFNDPENNRSWVLHSLKAEETYPGIIFIPETPRDAIDTIHHKANRARFSGTYLTTNSDLSWLLQEYYPSKIRRLGVTYKFESPKSTILETVTSSTNLTLTPGKEKPEIFLKFKDLQNSLKDWVSGGLGFLPEGEIRFKYRRAKELTGVNTSYEILPSASVIPVRASGSPYSDSISGDYLLPTISEISFSILKNTNGEITLITTAEELKENKLKLQYNFPDKGLFGVFEKGKLKISRLEQYLANIPDQPLEVSLIYSPTEKIVDQESIPFTYIPVTIDRVYLYENIEKPTEVTGSYITVTDSGPGEFYTLDLQEDSLYIQTDQKGTIISPSVTYAALYYNGKPVTGVSYSILPSSNVEASINSETGEITISGMSNDTLSSGLIVKARYNGMNFQTYLTCNKTISNLDPTAFSTAFSIYTDLSPDNYPIHTFQVNMETKEAVIPIPGGKYKSLSIKSVGGDVLIEDAVYTYSWTVFNNIIQEGMQTTPTLNLYYIPYSGSNPLDENEIDKFIRNNKSYYITQDILISPGKSIVAKFDISLDLYKNTSLDGTILDILQRYSYLFNQDFGGSIKTEGGEEFIQTDTYSEIKSLITKISEVKNVNSIKVTYLNPTTRIEIPYEEVKKIDIPVYYVVECVISSIVRE